MTSLVVRPWRPDDAVSLLTAFASDDLDSQGGPLATEQEAVRWIEGWQSGRDAGRAAAFAIAVDDVPVGGVALSVVERRNDTAQVTYWLAEFTRGLGLASRATAAVAAYGFEGLALFRLELEHRVNHPKSCQVATRAGFVAEGLERQKVRFDGERFDVEIHARLATDPTPEIDRLPIDP
ncbi:MAG: GNAT family protein [Ornithinimicrobium sp.]